MMQMKKPTESEIHDGIPDLTVVTVVFNALEGAGEDALKECLDSVQAQTDVNLEHIIVDGASSDGTTEYIASYVNKNHPIVFVSEPDKGIYDAMNKALAMASGEYAIFLNSDDLFHNPVGMRESLKRLRETGCDFSYAPVVVLNNGEVKEALHSYADGRLIFCSMPFSHQSMVFKTSSLRKVNGYDLSYRSASDYDMILRMVLSGCTGCYVDCTFATFRVGGFSLQYLDASRRECALIYSRLFPRHTGYPLSVEKAMDMFLWEFVPREFMEALVECYARSMLKWQPPMAEITPPDKTTDYVLDVRDARTDEDDWVDYIVPVWENEASKRVFSQNPPQDIVWGSDFWHICSPYAYCKNSCKNGAMCDGSLGILFRVPDEMRGRRLKLRVLLTSSSRPDMSRQRIRFAVNNMLFSSVSVKRGSFVCELTLPPAAAKDGFLGIEVNCGDACVSASARKAVDMMPQGFVFSYAKVEVA